MAPFKDLFKRKPHDSSGEKGSHKSGNTTASVTAEYDLISELGRGGFAVVNKVHKRGEAEGTVIAMRIVPLALVRKDPLQRDLDALRKRLTWAKTVRQTYNVTTPYILTLEDFRITKTELITFYEVMHGGDLFDLILGSPNGKLTESDARDATRSLCEGLSEIHRVGVIHRDVKPENVLMRFKGGPARDLVLTDFGCAITGVKGPDEKHTGAAGSPGYMPPEMLRGEPYTMVADEWSLGITVYEMLTGRSPLVSTEPRDIARETLTRDIPYPERYWQELSPEAMSFTQGLLEKDPAKRMAVEQARQHPWLAQTGQYAHTASSRVGAPHAGEDTTTMSVAIRKTLAASMRATRFGADMTGQTDFKEYAVGDVMAGKLSPSQVEALRGVDSESTTPSQSRANTMSV